MYHNILFFLIKSGNFLDYGVGLEFEANTSRAAGMQTRGALDIPFAKRVEPLLVGSQLFCQCSYSSPGANSLLLDCW